MRTTFLAAGIVLALCIATPASACEKCTSYFDYQSLTYCKECEFSYCGFFACVVRSYSGFEYCDSPWEEDDEESCFTQEGVATGRCPRIQDPTLREPTNDSLERQLIRSTLPTR